MKGRLIDLSQSMDGEYRLIFGTRDKAILSLWDELHEVDVDVTAKKWRRKRSLDANNYAWKLIDLLAEKLGRTKVEVYREAIRNIGGVSETVCVVEKAVDKLVKGWRRNGLGWIADIEPSKLPGCKNVRLFYGSSSYDSKQMSSLIDCLIQDCKAVGIETMTPQEIKALNEQLERQYQKGQKPKE